MKNNLIMKFDIDVDVKILLNNNIIGESGYKDIFKTTIEEDGLLTIKHGRKKANIRVLKEQINNIYITYTTEGQIKATFIEMEENNKEKEDIPKANINHNNNNATNEKDLEALSGAMGCIVGAIIFGLVFFFFVIDPLSNDSNSGCDTSDCSWAEQKALEDVPELGLAFSTVKSNELKCNAESITDDEIILVKCTTTHEELLDFYGSSTIWYGYLESASGHSYFRAAHADKNEVLSRLRR